jgi:hypothetical protein
LLYVNFQALAQQIAAAYVPPPRQGRRSDIADPQMIEAFLDAVHDGNYQETACDLAGISQSALQNWMRRGQEGEEPFAAFMRAVKRASAYAEAVEMGKVRKAGEDPRFWAASMTYLERRHPDRWARRAEHSDGPKVIVQIGLSQQDARVVVATPAELAE